MKFTEEEITELAAQYGNKKLPDTGVTALLYKNPLYMVSPLKMLCDALTDIYECTNPAGQVTENQEILKEALKDLEYIKDVDLRRHLENMLFNYPDEIDANPASDDDHGIKINVLNTINGILMNLDLQPLPPKSAVQHPVPGF